MIFIIPIIIIVCFGGYFAYVHISQLRYEVNQIKKALKEKAVPSIVIENKKYWEDYEYNDDEDDIW